MKVTMLGTGTPTPSLKRASSGYLIDIGDDVLVIDHGPGANRRLMQAGRRVTDVTHLFFSHLHYDHCMEYPHLLLQRWDIGAGLIPDLQVFGPPPLARMTDLLFGADGVFGPDIRARTEHQGSIDVFESRGGKPPRPRPAPVVRELEPGDAVEGRGWRLTVAEGWHVQPYLRCYGYRLESDGATLCYSGDSGGVCPEIVELAKGADVLIHMNHYFTGTEPTAIYRKVCGNHIDTAQVAKAAGVKTVVLTHLLEQIDQPGIRERMVREMAQIFAGDIIIGEDLLEIPIGGARLARME
jgi:ribonuclease BN (tRNA processing enzyme)